MALGQNRNNGEKAVFQDIDDTIERDGFTLRARIEHDSDWTRRMIEIRNKGGDVIRRSRNLRGVLDYARVSPVESVSITARHVPGDSSYHLAFRFDDGSTCTAVFADWRVAADFLSRRRSWHFGDWRNAAACDGVKSGPLVSGYPPAVARYYGTTPGA